MILPTRTCHTMDGLFGLEVFTFRFVVSVLVLMEMNYSQLNLDPSIHIFRRDATLYKIKRKLMFILS